MKKVLVVMMAITLLMMLCSCDNGTGLPIIGEVDEWISPDGVHYWTYNGSSRFGLAPRYDAEGKLVIEGR